MGSDNLLRVLAASVKAKITPLVTKLRLWGNINFIRTKTVARFRAWLVGVFDVRPKHKKDYYEIFGWLVSKRLAFAIVVAAGVLSTAYLLGMLGSFEKSADTVRTYSYRSVFLKFAGGRARIQGRGGYLAYEGEVDQGAANGYGRLYNRAGNLVYQGNFAGSYYEGAGIQYYDSGTMHYNGEFGKNLYEGSGRLYREGGSRWYDGAFAQGLMEGEGTLYDRGGNAVYTGNFTHGQIVYSDLLGKTATEAREMYGGKMDAWQGQEEFVVFLEDIDAAYVGALQADSLEDERKVERVYVLKDAFLGGSRMLTEISELENYFGKADYEGNSLITESEALCLKKAGDTPGILDMEILPVYDDYTILESYDDACEVYLYSFWQDGMAYTFVCEDKDAGFLFYSITAGGDAV